MCGSDAACEWRYLAEGAAHMVLAYAGPDPTLARKVLRLRKARRGSGSGGGGGSGGERGSPPTPALPPDDEARVRDTAGAGAGAGTSLTDAQLWAGHPGMQPHFAASTTTADEVSRAFVATVLTPLLGEALADAGDLVHVDDQFLAAVADAASPMRPPARAAGADIDPSARFALLLHNHNSPPDHHTPTNLHAPGKAMPDDSLKEPGAC